MTAGQRAYVRKVEARNPAYVVETLERADGCVIVDVRKYVLQVLGVPADGLRTAALVLIDVDGKPVE